jgi:hypothetical protein
MRERKYSYYHRVNNSLLKFLIRRGSSILVYGFFDPDLAKAVLPGRAVIVLDNENEYKKSAKGKGIERVLVGKYRDYRPREAFDYVFLNGAVGKSDDLVGLLMQVQGACSASTRLIVYQHNYLWQWVLSLAEKYKLKSEEGVCNWLSVSDIRSYLWASGFEFTRVYRRILVPVNVLGIGTVINFLFALVPVLDFLMIDQYLISRPDPNLFPLERPKSLTVCITVRNEKDNIEPIVKGLPIVARKQEILFVEGHSADGTWEEILRVARKYRSKNVRVIKQPGIGQGDAIRVGFESAKNDVVVLYEGDRTSNPEDLEYFYEAMVAGRFEFIEGSRFVYPLNSAAMPFSKKLGNVLFAKWFSMFLGQRSTDVLSGIKAILRRDYLILYENWGFLGGNDPFGDFELLYGAAKMGLKFGEIPMRYYPRIYGSPKSNVFKHGPYLAKMALRGYWVFRKN